MYNQILQSLFKLHNDLEICLLNLNLSKILLSESHSPYFYDFSTAKWINSNLVNSDFDLNIIDDSLKFYVAPEILNPDLRFQLKGDKIDVFALGVMIFVTLFRGAPFKAAT
jgi:serine/threonine protein kinase